MIIHGERDQGAGLENHSGQTFINELEPLGKVLSGYGNNGQDGTEGARYKNVFCSYLHGPLLPKNSRLTDLFIGLALTRRGLDSRLTPLNDELEQMAAGVITKRLLK